MLSFGSLVAAKHAFIFIPIFQNKYGGFIAFMSRPPVAVTQIWNIRHFATMTKGIKKTWKAVTVRQRRQVDELTVKWNIIRSDAIRLTRGGDLAVILLKYGRGLDGRAIYHTIGSRHGCHDVMSRRLPGSFGSAIK